jgi:hypothetical protein
VAVTRATSSRASFLLPLGAAVAAAAALSGCNLEQRYVMAPGGGLYTAAITETTPVFLEAEEEALFMVETRALFAVHPPTPVQMEALGGMASPPFDRRPWVMRDDYQIEIDFVVSNLEDRSVLTTLTVNGINEFNEYTPSAQIIDDDLVVDFANWERTYLLGPGERRVVTVREEELDEVAIDLASVVNTTAAGLDCGTIANTLTYFMNQSSIDDRSIPCVPAVIPGLVGVKIGLRVQAPLGELPPVVVVEAAVRMRDVHDRVAAGSEARWDTDMLSRPEPFTPPIPVMMP